MAFKTWNWLLIPGKRSPNYFHPKLNLHLKCNRHSLQKNSKRRFTLTKHTHKAEKDERANRINSGAYSTKISSSISMGANSHNSELPVEVKKPESALKTLQKALGSVSSPYSTYGASEIIFRECSKHAAYKTSLDGKNLEKDVTEDGEEMGIPEAEAQWHSEFCLPATFSTWSQVTMLYMYLLIVRIRNSTADQVHTWQKTLQNQFFFAAEDRMIINHNMSSGSVRAKYLKDLFLQWRGLIAAYDEGLIKGDAVLAAAIWRNVFKARENIDIRHLAQIVSYMRHTLQILDTLSTLPDLIDFKFPNILAEKSVILLPSQLMIEPFDKNNATKALSP